MCESEVNNLFMRLIRRLRLRSIENKIFWREGGSDKLKRDPFQYH